MAAPSPARTSLPRWRLAAMCRLRVHRPPASGRSDRRTGAGAPGFERGESDRRMTPPQRALRAAARASACGTSRRMILACLKGEQLEVELRPLAAEAADADHPPAADGQAADRVGEGRPRHVIDRSRRRPRAPGRRRSTALGEGLVGGVDDDAGARAGDQVIGPPGAGGGEDRPGAEERREARHRGEPAPGRWRRARAPTPRPAAPRRAPARGYWVRRPDTAAAASTSVQSRGTGTARRWSSSASSPRGLRRPGP